MGPSEVRCEAVRVKVWGRQRYDVVSSEVRCEAVRVKMWGREREVVRPLE